MTTIHRAQWIFDSPSPSELRQFERGAIAIDGHGFILGVGKATALIKLHPKARVIDHGDDAVITPGFVDSHVHAPQLEMIASAGYSLLEWLDKCTFPTEAKYSNKFYAARRWREFCDGLLRCGTTSAAVFATSHTVATEALLKIGDLSGLRLHIGKVLMDRNAPENLLQDADQALEELDKLILRWGDTSRTKVSMAVRFAPTSTPELLRGAGELLERHPGLLLQTHLGETQDEVKWVKELFPQSKNYTSVYGDNGLVTQRSLLGHCLYLEDEEVNLIRTSGAHVIHCPSSNFFLGSGLFNYSRMMQNGLSIALGSDVGAGWDLSLQSTARCCYEAQALQKYFVKPSELLYLATRAGAIALGCGADLGLLEKGHRADFLVHNLRGRSLVYGRAERSQSADELMSALLFLGGESTLQATYVQGDCLFKRKFPKA